METISLQHGVELAHFRHRIRLRFFWTCGRRSARPSFASWRMAMSYKLPSGYVLCSTSQC